MTNFTAGGAGLKIVKDGIARTADTFPIASVTVIVQSVYVAGVSALKLMVLFPAVADVVADSQLPP
jgi:hypothetical protein